MEKEVLSPPHSHHSCPLVEGTLHILGKLQPFIHCWSYLGFIMSCHHKWQSMKFKMEYSPSCKEKQLRRHQRLTE